MPLNPRRAPNCRGAFFVVVPVLFTGGVETRCAVAGGAGGFVLAGDAFGQHCLNWDEPLREAG